MTVELREWYTTGISAYASPEAGLCLAGKVYGHPKYKDGESVKTSCVIAVDGRKIHTQSREYLLVGDPDQGFVDFMAESGKVVDLDNPITVRQVSGIRLVHPIKFDESEG